MQKRHLIIGLFLMVCCAGLIVYPIIGNLAYSRASEQAYLDFAEQVEDTDAQMRQDALAAARRYNRGLANGVYEGFDEETIELAHSVYNEMLSINGSDVMGYLSIPAIDVQLPIYHGTELETLEKGLGHLIGTSLPVGGESTHAVITGHTGLPTNRLFTDLDRLVIGDRFQVRVMGETLDYEVCEINIVVPSDTSLLQIEPGKDYVTLLTCTPYGVNSHRLLVRGQRVEAAPEAEAIAEPTAPVETEGRGSTWTSQYIKGIIIGVGSGTMLIGILAVISKRRNRHA